MRGTLYAALVLSPVAHGELIGRGIDRAAILAERRGGGLHISRYSGGENNYGPIVHDDPFLAVGKVEFIGQAIAVVVARDMLYARGNFRQKSGCESQRTSRYFDHRQPWRPTVL